MVDNTKNCIVMEEEEMEAQDSDVDESKENEEKAKSNSTEELKKALVIFDDSYQDRMPINSFGFLLEVTMENQMRSFETFRKHFTYSKGYIYASHS